MVETSSETDYRSEKIIDLLLHDDVSVRLVNSIRGAHESGALPAVNVGAYLDLGPSAVQRFQRIPNMGRKTALELHELVSKFVNNYASLAKERLASKENISTLMNIKREIELITLESIFSQYIASTRLENLSRNGGLASLSLGDILFDTKNVLSKLIRTPNVGRKTVSELANVCAKAFRTILANRGLSGGEISLLYEFLIGRETPEPEHTALLQSIAIRLSNLCADDVSDRVIGHLSLGETIDKALGSLSERERDVIQRRYGFGDNDRETLEEIGGTYSVTRERIRQIEKNAWRKLKKPIWVRQLEYALGQETDAIWDTLSAGNLAISPNRLISNRKFIKGYRRLAIDLFHGSLEKWFASFAKSWGQGWYYASVLPEELDRLESQLTDQASITPLPRPVVSMKNTDEPILLEIVKELSAEFVLFDGYILAGFATVRPRRCVRLHKLMMPLGRPRELSTIIGLYHKLYEDDPCSARDAEIVMNDSPHLFLRLFEEKWIAVGSVDTGNSSNSVFIEPPTQESSGTNHGSLSNAEDVDMLESLDGDDDSIADVLKRILRKNGPLRLVDLVNATILELPKEKSRNSLGPILLTQASFVRPLPGLYALREQLPSDEELLRAPPDYLKAEDQIRWYVQARKANEDTSFYTLWRPTNEYIWCSWSRHNADPKIYQSLLSVAQPETWPVDKKTIKYWNDLKRQEQDYQLFSSPRYSLNETVPNLASVLSALYYLRERKQISWMAGNRLLKKRIDNHKSVGLLAILVGLGAVTPPQHWQLRHTVTEQVGRSIEQLSRQLFETGSLQWNDPTGKMLTQTIQQKEFTQGSSWLTAEDLDQLVSGIGAQHMDTQEGKKSYDDDPLEALLDQLHNERQQDALGHTLTELTNSSND